jgi:hypothetical protein
MSPERTLQEKRSEYICPCTFADYYSCFTSIAEKLPHVTTDEHKKLAAMMTAQNLNGSNSRTATTAFVWQSQWTPENFILENPMYVFPATRILLYSTYLQSYMSYCMRWFIRQLLTLQSITYSLQLLGFKV